MSGPSMSLPDVVLRLIDSRSLWLTPLRAELARDDDEELFFDEPAKLTLPLLPGPDSPLNLLPLRTDEALEIVDDVRINGNAAVS